MSNRTFSPSTGRNLLGRVKVELVVLGVLLAFLTIGVALPLDRGEIFARHVSCNVYPVETRGLELRELRIDRAHRGLERVQILINDRVRPDLARDLLLVPPGGDKLGTRGHVDSIDVGKSHRRRCRGEK